MDEPRLLKPPRYVKVPPTAPLAPGACFMCRAPMSDHRDCSRCDGSGRGFLLNRATREAYPCDLCDGFATECPR